MADIDQINDQTDKNPVKPIITGRMLKANTYLSNYLSNGYNGTQAYKAVKPDVTIATAHANGSRMLNSAIVQSVLQEVLDRNNVSIELQLVQLANIAKGEYSKSTIYETYDRDGELVRKQVVTSKPSAKDITSAINLIARLTGQYDAMRVNANAMSSELKRLYRQHTTGDGRRDPSKVASGEVAGGEEACVHVETDPSLRATQIFNRGISPGGDSPGVNEAGEALSKDGTRKGKRGGARVKRPLTERIKHIGLSTRGSEGTVVVEVPAEGEIADPDGNVASEADLGPLEGDLKGLSGNEYGVE